MEVISTLPDSYSNIIAAFDTTTKQWNKLGELNQARHGHGVILHQGQFIVVGSYSDEAVTEQCTLKGDSVVCTPVSSEHEVYWFQPNMMSVTENFCPK